MFDNIDTTGVEKAKDILGGSFIKESDVYDATIKYAYGFESKGGARGLQFEFALEDGTTLRQQIYYTSGKEKGQKVYSEKNGVKTPLAGFVICDNIAKIVTGGQELKTLGSSVEKKVISAYNFDKKENEDKAVEMVMALVGGKVKLGVLKQVVDKNVEKTPGVWVPGGETRDENEINAVFHPEKLLTVVEAEAGKEEPAFYHAWLEKNKGKTVNKAKGAKAGTGGGTAGRPQSSGQSGGTERPNLFNS